MLCYAKPAEHSTRIMLIGESQSNQAPTCKRYTITIIRCCRRHPNRRRPDSCSSKQPTVLLAFALAGTQHTACETALYMGLICQCCGQ